jgi:hypothetical protein
MNSRMHVLRSFVPQPPLVNLEALPFGASSGRAYALGESAFYLVAGADTAPDELTSLCQAAAAYRDWCADPERALAEWVRSEPASCARIVDMTAKAKTALADVPAIDTLANHLGVPVCAMRLVDDDADASTQLVLSRIAHPIAVAAHAKPIAMHANAGCWVLHVDARWHLLLPHQPMTHLLVPSPPVSRRAAAKPRITVRVGQATMDLDLNPQVRRHCLALLDTFLERISKSRAGTAQDRAARIDTCADEHADLARALDAHPAWLRSCAAAKHKQLGAKAKTTKIKAVRRR